MAGHSKWSKIKRIKETKDIQKSRILNKVKKSILNKLKSNLINDQEFAKNIMKKAKKHNLKSKNLASILLDKKEVTKKEKNILKKRVYGIHFKKNVFALIQAETDNESRTIAKFKEYLRRSGYKFVSEESIKNQFTLKYLVKLTIDRDLDDIAIKIIDKITEGTQPISDFRIGENFLLFKFLESEFEKFETYIKENLPKEMSNISINRVYEPLFLAILNKEEQRFVREFVNNLKENFSEIKKAYLNI